MPGSTMCMSVLGSACLGRRLRTRWLASIPLTIASPTRFELRWEIREEEHIVGGSAWLGSAAIISNASPGNTSRRCWRGLAGDTSIVSIEWADVDIPWTPTLYRTGRPEYQVRLDIVNACPACMDLAVSAFENPPVGSRMAHVASPLY